MNYPTGFVLLLTAFVLSTLILAWEPYRRSKHRDDWRRFNDVVIILLALLVFLFAPAKGTLDASEDHNCPNYSHWEPGLEQCIGN